MQRGCHPKAFGGAMGFVKSLLSEMEFRPSDVFGKERTANVARYFAKSRCDDALKALDSIGGATA